MKRDFNEQKGPEWKSDPAAAIKVGGNRGTLADMRTGSPKGKRRKENGNRGSWENRDSREG